MGIFDKLKNTNPETPNGFQKAFGGLKSAWEEAGEAQQRKGERRAARQKRQKAAPAIADEEHAQGTRTLRKPTTTARERSNRRRYGQTADTVASNFVDVGAAAPEPAPQPGLLERIGFERFLPNPTGHIENVQPSGPRPNRLHIDVPLLLVLISLVVFGMLMVYSASADFSYEVHRSSTYLFLRQLAFLGLGIAAAGVLTWLNYHVWQKLAVYAMGATVFALFAVFFVGDQRHGAVRTIFNGSVQPSELAKVITVIYLAVWLYSKREVLHDVSFGLLPLGVILGLIGGLIWLQPDLSAVLTVVVIGGTMFFLANSDIRQIGILLTVAVGIGMLVVITGGLTATGHDRVASFIAGWQDPLQASYHVQRSLEAFVKGGVFGVGIGNANTKLTGLPVPHTDSIFAVVGEETGLIGATAMVILYTLLLWRGLSIARRAPDGLGQLLAAGLSIWLALEAYINMAVMVGLMPFAGNALPFVSVGGSNLVMSLIAVGIILNVSRLSERTVEEQERTFSEVVDLRGRHGGRRVSGTRRASRATARTQERANDLGRR
ncbi:MAG: FtsW/RodA/SpoVE family cell cycle protein [Chloroflexota bacterium]